MNNRRTNRRLTAHLRQMADIGGGAMQCFVLANPAQLRGLIDGADPLAAAVLNAIARTLADIRRLPEPRHVLCLTCDERFWSEREPDGFAVLVPDNPASRGGLCCPLCAVCCRRPDCGAAVQAKLAASITGVRMVANGAIHTQAGRA